MSRRPCSPGGSGAPCRSWIPAAPGPASRWSSARRTTPRRHRPPWPPGTPPWPPASPLCGRRGGAATPAPCPPGRSGPTPPPAAAATPPGPCCPSRSRRFPPSGPPPPPSTCPKLWSGPCVVAPTQKSVNPRAPPRAPRVVGPGSRWARPRGRPTAAVGPRLAPGPPTGQAWSPPAAAPCAAAATAPTRRTGSWDPLRWSTPGPPPNGPDPPRRRRSCATRTRGRSPTDARNGSSPAPGMP